MSKEWNNEVRSILPEENAQIQQAILRVRGDLILGKRRLHEFLKRHSLRFLKIGLDRFHHFTGFLVRLPMKLVRSTSRNILRWIGIANRLTNFPRDAPFDRISVLRLIRA